MKARPDHEPATLPWGLFVTDLDGTLLTDEKRISANNLGVLRALQRSRCRTAIATGRSDYSLLKLLDQLGFSQNGTDRLPIDYYIFSTGAGVMSGMERSVLKTAALSCDDVLAITAILDQCHIDYMVHRPVPDTRWFVYRHHGEPNPDFFARLAIYQQYARQYSPEALSHFGAATEVLCIIPRAREAELDALVWRLSRYSVIRATSPLDHQTLWLEIFPPTVSKSLTLSWLAEFLRVKRDFVCAVGNDYNDTDMLAWVGSGFAVANSPASIKDHFPVVADNNCDGVAGAVAAWLEKMGMGSLF
jgi:Cof subfamily protein (haloacid dehalogenase superfamily)